MGSSKLNAFYTYALAV